VRFPSVQGQKLPHLTESVDIMPTLVELAGLEPLPLCKFCRDPMDKACAATNSNACTEGRSAAPLFNAQPPPVSGWKQGAFSQYPRPAKSPDNGFLPELFTPPLHSGPRDTPCCDCIRASPSSCTCGEGTCSRQEAGLKATVSHLTEGVMGFTVRADEYRYTEYVWFDPVKARVDWSRSWGVELYTHLSPHSIPDGSFDDENENVAADPKHADLVASLSKQLHAGWRPDQGARAA